MRLPIAVCGGLISVIFMREHARRPPRREQ
jgi:hypothetical protein